MNDFIIQSYGLLFDYIKPCLNPKPTVEYAPSTIPAIVRFVLTVTFQGMPYWENREILQKVYNCRDMMAFMENPAEMTATVAHLFSKLKNQGEYEMFLSVLKNMIRAGKITKDEGIKILTESKNHEALVELLHFDMEENQDERFDL